jgi:hypothetical protein
MSKNNPLNKQKLLSDLAVDTKDLEKADDVPLEQMSLARSFLKLADINQEKEYLLCRNLAARLLGKVPEPEELDID